MHAMHNAFQVLPQARNRETVKAKKAIFGAKKGNSLKKTHPSS